MAKLKITMPTALLDELDALGTATDEVIDEAIEAGGKIALAAVRTELDAVVGKGTKTASCTGGRRFAALKRYSGRKRRRL